MHFLLLPFLLFVLVIPIEAQYQRGRLNHSCYATLYSRKSSPSNFGPQQTARINFENFDFFQINISALKLTPAKPNLLNSMQKILLYLPRQTKQFVMFYLINQRFKSKLRFEEFFSFAAI